MGRTRKAPTRAMIETEKRVAGMKAIDDKLDLGDGVSVTVLETALGEASDALEDYNMSLAVSDEKLNVFNEKEAVVRQSRKKILPAVGLKYGTDSSEYEQVGGVRDSERAKRGSKTKPSS